MDLQGAAYLERAVEGAFAREQVFDHSAGAEVGVAGAVALRKNLRQQGCA